MHLFGAQYPPHLFPCLRFAVHLAMPIAKLLLSCEKFSFSASCRFSPAHSNRDFSSRMTRLGLAQEPAWTGSEEEERLYCIALIG